MLIFQKCAKMFFEISALLVFVGYAMKILFVSGYNIFPCVVSVINTQAKNKCEKYKLLSHNTFKF